MAQAATAGGAQSARSDASGYFGCARVYALDLTATAFLFVSVSLFAGRIWRFPFDDEVSAVAIGKATSFFTLLTVYPATADVHPPLLYLLFHGLDRLGIEEPGMRLCSLTMTTLALLIYQILALLWTARRNQGAVPIPTRLSAILLFGLNPLAIGQGDALRWYPLLALFIALFVALYLEWRTSAGRLVSAVFLGLAASTNFIAVTVVAALAAYRYALERQFRRTFDTTFWIVAACCASLGIYSALSLLLHRRALVHSQFESTIAAVPTDILGFFGGDALGVSQVWIVIPTAIIAALAAWSAIDRSDRGRPQHLLLLMLIAIAPLALAGFGKPRSFLYLAPIVALLITEFLDRRIRHGRATPALAMIPLLLATSVSAIANINGGTHPFKRNSSIPYQSILDFIDGNQKGTALIITTDPVLPAAMQNPAGNRRVGLFMAAARCLNSGQRYDTIFIISGHSDRSANKTAMERFNRLVADATAGRTKIATFGAGLDEDAALKSRLTGVPLEKYILTIDEYR